MIETHLVKWCKIHQILQLKCSYQQNNKIQKCQYTVRYWFPVYPAVDYSFLYKKIYFDWLQKCLLNTNVDKINFMSSTFVRWSLNYNTLLNLLAIFWVNIIKILFNLIISIYYKYLTLELSYDVCTNLLNWIKFN